MVKAGSIIAIGAKEDDAEYDYSDQVTLRAYELSDNNPSTTVVYDNKQKLAVEAEVAKSGSTITIDVKSQKAYTVVLINVSNIASVDNGSFEIKGNDTMITPSGKGKMICTLK